MRRLISGTAAAASGRLTVIRTSSEPALASSMHCLAVLAGSAVSVFAIDCTTIGAPPPTCTLPTRTPVVWWRCLWNGLSVEVMRRPPLATVRSLTSPPLGAGFPRPEVERYEALGLVEVGALSGHRMGGEKPAPRTDAMDGVGVSGELTVRQVGGGHDGAPAPALAGDLGAVGEREGEVDRVAHAEQSQHQIVAMWRELDLGVGDQRSLDRRIRRRPGEEDFDDLVAPEAVARTRPRGRRGIPVEGRADVDSQPAGHPAQVNRGPLAVGRRGAVPEPGDRECGRHRQG